MAVQAKLDRCKSNPYFGTTMESLSRKSSNWTCSPSRTRKRSHHCPVYINEHGRGGNIPRKGILYSTRLTRLSSIFSLASRENYSSPQLAGNEKVKIKRS